MSHLFTAEIVDIDVRLTKAELTIDGEILSFTEKDNSYIVFDSKNGVFTMYLQTKSQLKKDFPNSKFLKFWAIPKTFKTLIEESTDGKYEFKAKMYSTEPRKSKGSPTPEIEMICELEYEI